MKHLLTVLEARHLAADGRLLWEQRAVPNLFHVGGELYCLSALFNTAGTAVPANYFAGLDNRATPAATDTLGNLSQEPTQFAYARQAVSSANGFTIALNSDGIYQATSSVLTFVATGGSWGPVRTVFLATTAGNAGQLISTAALDGQHTVADGDTLTIRIALALKDCP